MEHMQISDAAFNQGQGGFWIDPEGLLVPVLNYAEHWETTKLMGLGGYDDAYQLGMVRVSLYDRRMVAVNYDRRYVTVAALQAAARLLRHAHFAEGWTTWELNYEDVKTDWQSTEKFYHKFETRDLMARHIMQDALKRNARLREVEAQIHDSNVVLEFMERLGATPVVF